MHRTKFWCEPCDFVTKARCGATCPTCGMPMRYMGDKWRVGRKGHRAEYVPDQTLPAWLIYGNMRERMKMLGKIVYDRKRGEYTYEATYRNRKRTR